MGRARHVMEAGWLGVEIRRSVDGCRQRPLRVEIGVPSQGVEANQTGNGSTRDLHASLEPRLPADVAAWNEGPLPVDNDKFGVHDAEGEEEQALDSKVDGAGLQQLRVGQAQLRLPRRGRVDVAIAGLRMEELLEQ